MAGTGGGEGCILMFAHHCQNCPQCAYVSNPRHSRRPLLQPIPVERAFQIVGVDIMDLPKTKRGNQHVIVFQDFLTKWPLFRQRNKLKLTISSSHEGCV